MPPKQRDHSTSLERKTKKSSTKDADHPQTDEEAQDKPQASSLVKKRDHSTSLEKKAQKSSKKAFDPLLTDEEAQETPQATSPMKKAKEFAKKDSHPPQTDQGAQEVPQATSLDKKAKKAKQSSKSERMTAFHDMGLHLTIQSPAPNPDFVVQVRKRR